MLQDEVGAQFRSVREERGWTQDAVAAEFSELLAAEGAKPSFTNAGVSAIEKGIAGASLNRLELLARVLLAKLYIFLVRDDDPAQPAMVDRQSAEMIAAWRAASPVDRDLLHRLLLLSPALQDDDREYITSLVRVLERRQARPPA